MARKAITFMGTNTVYVALYKEWVDGKVLLTADLAEYHAPTYTYLRDEVRSVEIWEEDPEDLVEAAQDAASNIECLAVRLLEERKSLGRLDVPFDEAVAKALSADLGLAEPQPAPVAAE